MLTIEEDSALDIELHWKQAEHQPVFLKLQLSPSLWESLSKQLQSMGTLEQTCEGCSCLTLVTPLSSQTSMVLRRALWQFLQMTFDLSRLSSTTWTFIDSLKHG